MSLTTRLRAHVFHDLNAAIKLADKNPSLKNIEFLQKLTGVKISNENITQIHNAIYKAQNDLLIGQSIEPKKASSMSSKVSFNGYGEIISLKTLLKKRDIKLLTKNIVKPLKETPVKITDGKIRTVAECAIDMAGAIKKSNLQTGFKTVMLDEIKGSYLSGGLSINKLGLFLERYSIILENNTPLNQKLHELLESVEKEFYVTKHNDNYYGRTFDSTIAELVVSKPSKEMNKNIKIIRNKLMADFDSLNNRQKLNLVESIYAQMVHDPAIWRPAIPEVEKFLYDCTPDNFANMLNTKSELNHLLIMHLSVKYVLYSPGLKDVETTASRLYSDVISRQRTLNRVKNTQEKSNRTGIKLHYQMQGHIGQPDHIGVRPIDRYRSSVDKLTEHNFEALASERSIGIGMSGSSNLLNHLFISLDDEFSDFNIEHARLMAASFLTYSGGHSLNEAYTVFGYYNRESFKPVSYSALIGGDNYMKSIIDLSYDKLIEEAISLN